MSDANMFCTVCGTAPVASAWQICKTCSQKKQLQKASANTAHQPVGSVATPIWDTVSEDATKITSGGSGLFGKTVIDNLLPEVVACITDKQDTAATGAKDAQVTIWPKGVNSGTVSVDWQGVRAGTYTSRWVDIQGQAGGGGSKRKSYFQILVQLGSGIPPDETLTDAIRTSTRNASRVVVFIKGNSARPL